ncbi:hypothetical protein N8T08_009688 [Aspergillus melleus]|uniref:Uncharacterized protein n=1 Tax=Aspergillus melleus TaxID=138277 RepID=A0ACC3ATN3_9EURO|nr:hypothetical protein N8T08_009688 [Aspergillus melleus]
MDPGNQASSQSPSVPQGTYDYLAQAGSAMDPGNQASSQSPSVPQSQTAILFQPGNSYPSWFVDDIQVPQGNYIYLAQAGSAMDPVTRRYAPEPGSCVVAISGASTLHCDGMTKQASTYAIFYGKDNLKNHVAKGDEEQNDRHVLYVAEMQACIYALNDAFNFQEYLGVNGQMLARLVIKFSTKGLKKALTKSMPTWRNNEWNLLKSGGKFFYLVKELSDQLDKLEKTGTDVNFWFVPKSETKEATDLADSFLLSLQKR